MTERGTWVSPDHLESPAEVRRRRLEELLEARLERLPLLMRLTAAAQEAQWLPPRRAAVPPADGPEDLVDPALLKGKPGRPSDPTSALVFNERRQAVRHAVRQAERYTLQAVALLQGAEAALERALAEWETPRSDT